MLNGYTLPLPAQTHGHEKLVEHLALFPACFESTGGTPRYEGSATLMHGYALLHQSAHLKDSEKFQGAWHCSLAAQGPDCGCHGPSFAA